MTGQSRGSILCGTYGGLCTELALARFRRTDVPLA